MLRIVYFDSLRWSKSWHVAVLHQAVALGGLAPGIMLNSGDSFRGLRKKAALPWRLLLYCGLFDGADARIWGATIILKFMIFSPRSVCN